MQREPERAPSESSTSQHLSTIAGELSRRLLASGERLVLAESCTSGLIAAKIAETPGISANFCGSSVVYREATKIAWLDVSAELIQRATAVSQEVTTALAHQVLARTPEATLGLGITGHLGPDAPVDLDGRVFLSVWTRQTNGQLRERGTRTCQLRAQSRTDRQREAASLGLQLLLECVGS